MSSSGASLPLERREIHSAAVNGVHQTLPALHKAWAQNRVWMAFKPPPLDDTGLAEWTERTAFVLDDLDFLLELDHHAFWSQMVHDSTVQPTLVRILQFLPRSYDLESGRVGCDGRANEMLLEVRRKVFLVFVRLCTCREAPDKFITPEKHGSLIYDNFLVDIPRLMDLCVLFRESSPQILAKMVATVFKNQPRYGADLSDTTRTIVEAMSSVIERTDTTVMQSTCDVNEVSDLVSYAADIMVTVNSFLLTYPPAARTFSKEGFDVKLGAFYNSSIVVLCQYLAKQRQSGLLEESSYSDLRLRLQLCRLSAVSCLRQLIEVNCVEKALAGGKTEGEEGSEAFLSILTNCLGEGLLALDYAHLHPVEEDAEVFAQAGFQLDQTRIQYILDGIRSLLSDTRHGAEMAETKLLEKQVFQSEAVREAEEAAAKAAARDEIKSAPSGPKGKELDDLISQVRDLLPDLGAGFVEACLTYFDYNPERVINSLLEENLPPHLIELDRQTARKVEEQDDVPKRHNVFDGDEFDINCRESVDKTRVHKGKHAMAKVARNANALLDDKKDIKNMKDKFAALSIVSEDVYLSKADAAAANFDAEYDDEYDDTYDDNAIGQEEPDAMDAKEERRPFVLPRALGGGHVTYVKEKDQDQDEEGEDEEAERKRKDHFVRNPAEVREERERRWRDSNRARGGRPPPNRDVVGKPKGQGQDKNVTINRSRKNANKGKHNRAMADKKQSRGMF